jgi:hypothetical protein
MLESGLSGSVRGVPSNGHPYRDPGPKVAPRSVARMEPPGCEQSPHSTMSFTCFARATHAPIRKARSVPVET